MDQSSSDLQKLKRGLNDIIDFAIDAKKEESAVQYMAMR